jgi:hypothetical protein
VTGTFKHGNELLGSLKCGEIFDQLSDYQFLKKDGAS